MLIARIVIISDKIATIFSWPVFHLEQWDTAGVKVMEGVCVEKVIVEKERVTGVLTDKGEVKCEVFVNCGGQVHSCTVDSITVS